MVECMIPDPVPAFDDHSEYIRIFPYIIAYHEKGGLDVVFIQQLQYPRSYFRDGTIVEGQINSLLVGTHPEDSFRI